jgi:hypothetical protein
VTLARIYSTLERSLFAVLALLCLGAALIFCFMVATNIEVRHNVAAWLAILGGLVLSAVSLKIVLTGSGWPYFEQKIPYHPPPPGEDG